MGQSTPTTTIALDIFLQRYSQFRSELHPREQAWFDELVCRARRHSNAINRRPHMDFERPVMLAMMLEGMREVEDLRQEVEGLRLLLQETREVLVESGLAERRVVPPSPFELGRVGQTVLAEA
ncbi:MAG TPA: hypothetical protein VFH47_07445 [Candidatus Thermoplasmatota archaeon]|nr:hypothetical protein [Candidatus Thermoplasmatota archaeon]